MLIEVVIPAYNAGRFLRETLHSVAAQTVRPAVVTVVDDGSSDDTLAVARTCQEELASTISIRIISNSGSKGPSAARNTALRQSKADWIALLDADDLLAADHHAVLLQAVQGAQDVVLSFGNSEWFYDDGQGQRRTLFESYFAISGVDALPTTPLAPGIVTPGDAIFPAMFDHGVFGTSACLFRREVAVAAGLFDEAMSYSEDTDFFLRLAVLGRFAFTREKTTYKRVHDTNLSLSHNKLEFCHGTLFSLGKLVRPPLVERLTPAQRGAAERALGRAATAYLYHASRRSLSAYGRAARLAIQCGRGAMAANPRHLLRLMATSLSACIRGRVPVGQQGGIGHEI